MKSHSSSRSAQRSAASTSAPGASSSARSRRSRGQRPGVDADADRDRHVRLPGHRRYARSGGGVHDLAHVLLRHRPRVDAYARRPGLDRRKRQTPVVVDVGDDRHLGAPGERRSLAHHASERRRLLGRRQAHAHDLAAGVHERAHLRERRLGVAGARARHRLHGDRGAAADGHGAHLDAPPTRHRALSSPGSYSPSRPPGGNFHVATSAPYPPADHAQVCARPAASDISASHPSTHLARPASARE